MKTADYWKDRFEQIEKICHDKGAVSYREIEEQYRKAQKEIESRISVWYQRFAVNNGITMQEARRLLTSRELAELKWDVNEYIKYGQQNAIDGKWMKQLENASAKAHISRLEALKLQVQQQVEVAFGNQLDSIDSTMRAVYSMGYMHTAFEIQKGVGVGHNFAALNQRLIDGVLKRPWAPDGKNFSDRVWSNKQKLINELNTTLTQGIILGKDPGKIINAMSKKLDVSKTAAGRLVMTESAAFASRAQEDCFKELDVEEYEIVATLDSHTSEICQDMDGKVFKMSERQIGVNAPPFHVNCVLPDSVVYAPDAEMLTQSDYSGDVIEVRTANGRCFTVTPNHIMLTARGWVRAKDIVKGDKVIYYCGWDKFITETNPTNNHCVLTIENLFTSFVEDGTVIPATMPTTAEDFKGDAIENGEVNIILVDSFLRDKFNPMQRKFLCDSPLIWTELRDGEIILPGNGTAARFLVCVGLSSDGIMGGGRVADIFFRGSLTHHELIRFRKRAHYNTRLFKTAFNGSCSDAEAPGKFLDAASRFIHGDNFINGEFPPCVRVTDCDSIFFKGSRDWLSADTKGVCDFADAFAGIVEFDNVVGINVGFYSGHVYDASSQSTLYYCNGFLSSNCRTTTAPYFDDWEELGIDRERVARNAKGDKYFVDGNMTYKEWEKKFVEVQKTDVDFMGQPRIFDGGNFKIKAYEVKGLRGIYTQTNSIEAQNTIKYIENMRLKGVLHSLDGVVVAKNLPGIAAYDHAKNLMYVNEQLCNKSIVHEWLKDGYFIAENVDDILKHEMFHKKHWDFIMTKGNDYGIIKNKLETDLHKYVAEQQMYNPSYITRIVCDNAYNGYRKKDNLNELIAEVLLQEEKGIIKDKRLLELVKRCVE